MKRKSIRPNIRLVIGLSLLTLTLFGCSKSGVIGIESRDLHIEPGVGLGPIKFGMPMDEVPALLGDPDPGAGKVLHYQRLGIAIIPSNGSHVGAIMMGDSAGSFLVDRFQGETKEGIGMRATREMIVKVFGEPQEANTPPAKMLRREEARQGLESISYDSDNLKFVLKDGELVHITLQAQKN